MQEGAPPLTFRPLAVLRAFCAALLALSLVACQLTELTTAGLLPYASAGMPDVGVGGAQIRASSVMVTDYASGRTLYSEDPDGLRYPASLTKMMTLYLLFDAIQKGYVTPDTQLRVSERAASKEPSKLGLKAGSTISVRDAARTIPVKSPNDVATVVAENLGGSEEAFAAAMTRKARELGMMHTRFVNATGLPDPRQVSTAHDMASLGRALLMRFPGYHDLFAASEITYNGVTFHATNRLLGKVPGVDGLKTGYIRDAGFHLVATAHRDGKRIIVVVMGGRTGRERNERVTQLIDEYLGPAPVAAFAER